jgi:hypothetical protein
MTGKARTEPAGRPAPEPVPVPEQPTPVNPPSSPQEPPADPPGGEDTADRPDAVLRMLAAELSPTEVAEVARQLLAEAGLAAEPLTDDPGRVLSAPEALVEALRRVQPIAKGRKAAEKVGGYAFRGIDDVYDQLHGVLAAVGLVVLPEPLAVEHEQRATSGGNTTHITRVLVRFTFLAADGTREACSAWGEGGDTGDKSTQKAHSQAMKTAMLEAFMIPTQASADDDPDADSPPPGRAFTPEEQQRAATALVAARDAATLDALAAVGNRAFRGGLLDVPVVAEQGGAIAPLRLHLDALREALEKAAPDTGGGAS